MVSLTGERSFAVVIPFFNEERNVEAVCGELRSFLDGEFAGGEVILVNDGSDDGTGATLDKIARHWPACRVFHLEENQGQSAALLFGFGKSNAPVFVTMDGDGQNDAHDIPRLLVALEDADMVVGARVDRQDTWMRRRISRIANGVRSEWLGDGVSDAGCALKAFRREVVSAFIPIRTLYSFMPSLAVAAGFRVIEMPVRHRRRRHGVSRYSVRSFLFLPIVDFIGLRWFRSRRCPAGSGAPTQDRCGGLAEELYRRVYHKWLRVVASVFLVGALALLIIQTRRPAEGMPARKVGLLRAERIALQQVPKGRIGSELVRFSHGRPTWTIDVNLPASNDLNEIDIDGVDGHIIASRTESAAEEALETAAEEHPDESTSQFRR